MSDKGMIMGDIKGVNILVHEENNKFIYKITDFGALNKIDND